MRRYIPIGVVAMFLAGCSATSSNIAPMGPDSFMVSRQAATGFSGAGTLKAEALAEAEQYCAGRGKVFQATNVTEAQPPYVFGNFPKAEVQFTCLAAGDPRLGQARKQ